MLVDWVEVFTFLQQGCLLEYGCHGCLGHGCLTVGFELVSLGQQANVPLIRPHLLVVLFCLASISKMKKKFSNSANIKLVLIYCWMLKKNVLCHFKTFHFTDQL